MSSQSDEQHKNPLSGGLILYVFVFMGLYLVGIILNARGRIPFPDVVALARIWRGSVGDNFICIPLWAFVLTFPIILAMKVQDWKPSWTRSQRIVLALGAGAFLYIVATYLLQGFPVTTSEYDPVLDFHFTWGLVGEALLFIGGFVVAAEMLHSSFPRVISVVLGIVGGYIFYGTLAYWGQEPVTRMIFDLTPLTLWYFMLNGLPLMILISFIPGICAFVLPGIFTRARLQEKWHHLSQ